MPREPTRALVAIATAAASTASAASTAGSAAAASIAANRGQRLDGGEPVTCEIVLGGRRIGARGESQTPGRIRAACVAAARSPCALAARTERFMAWEALRPAGSTARRTAGRGHCPRPMGARAADDRAREDCIPARCGDRLARLKRSGGDARALLRAGGRVLGA